MNQYTVLWDAEVEADFLRAWVQSESKGRAHLTEVANAIDSRLSVSANTVGEKQQDGSTRAVVIRVGSDSITVFFEASEADRQVLIHCLVTRTKLEPR